METVTGECRNLELKKKYALNLKKFETPPTG
jgi:hypothetical protein